jgi:plastocyanin
MWRLVAEGAGRHATAADLTGTPGHNGRRRGVDASGIPAHREAFLTKEADMTLSRRRALAIAAAAPLAVLVPGAAMATTYRVVIQNHRFHPDALEIAAGDTVIFTNNDSSHTATFVDGSFDSGTLARGESAQVTLSAPGTYSYFCRFHGSMKGAIVVR